MHALCLLQDHAEQPRVDVSCCNSLGDFHVRTMLLQAIAGQWLMPSADGSEQLVVAGSQH